ncbi:unnamed protein product [Gordionus sp. m RMFG-2023]
MKNLSKIPMSFDSQKNSNNNSFGKETPTLQSLNIFPISDEDIPNIKDAIIKASLLYNMDRQKSASFNSLSSLHEDSNNYPLYSQIDSQNFGIQEDFKKSKRLYSL